MAYNPTTWGSNDVITKDKLNKIEQGINTASKLSGTDIDTDKNWNRKNITNVDFIEAKRIRPEASDEVQKKNAWLSGVAERENKRANKLQEEKVSTTTLLGKTIQEKNELQKRVDAAKYYMKNIFSGDAEVDQCHLGDLLDILDGKIVDEIEQALKGGDQ